MQNTWIITKDTSARNGQPKGWSTCQCCVTRSKTQNCYVLADTEQSPSCKWGRDMHPGGTGACFKYFFRFKGRSLGTRKKAGTEIHQSPKETGAPRVRCDVKQLQKGALHQPRCCKQHMSACQCQHRSWSSFKSGGPKPNWRKSLYKGKKKTQPFRRTLFGITALTPLLNSFVGGWKCKCRRPVPDFNKALYLFNRPVTISVVLKEVAHEQHAVVTMWWLCIVWYIVLLGIRCYQQPKKPHKQLHL